VVVVWDERPGGSTLSQRLGADLVDIAGAAVAEDVVPVGETPHYIVIPGKLSLLDVRHRLSGWIG
jgi:hypothetical protein